jgi:hypothetical protein
MAAEDAKNPVKGVSGPGKYAKRIDRMPSNFYGDTTETAADAAGAPLAKTGDVKAMPMGQIAPATAQAAPTPSPVVPLFAPSLRPNEPVTHGVDAGPGAGSDALMMKSQFANVKLSDTLSKMLPYDSSGEVGILYQQALSRGL